MSNTIYKCGYFGDIEKYTWVDWSDKDGRVMGEPIKRCTGILLGRSSDGYFKFLALYKDGVPFNYPQEYCYHNMDFKRVNMKRYYHKECVEYSKDSNAAREAIHGAGRE